ncbi:hypothetical protein M569_01841 [Genlisea aurea]|uniref:GrpE protein homolog n=1 Tax=Genlisea aurea TaxID=192259 RepID=S8D0N2_9LAMI|nr:hypothetical protein M569_01841 [Genlisea aurea]
MTSRFASNLFRQFRSSVLLRCRDEKTFHSLTDFVLQPCRFSDKVVPGSLSSLHHSSMISSFGHHFGFSSSASPQANEKAASQSANDLEKKGDSEAAKTEATTDSEESVDSDSESELSKDDLVKLVLEKDQLLLSKKEEVEKLKDKILRTLAEMENVKERTRRESVNTKKFAIQNFAKGLLDVADNLGRASSAAKESFSKIDVSKDTTGAAHQLKTLLEGVEMTEKQLIEVFKKHGLEKYEPGDEEFDPNRHNAVFQVPDPSKPEGRVAVVLKAGYVLHDRVIRPAEVGVTAAAGGE